MQEHKFTVGTLTELAPHEHPNLLGLNKNAGEVILIRLRTDAYDGFRLYADIRRVLCHELTHNVWGDHDDNVGSTFATSPAHADDYLSSRCSTRSSIERSLNMNVT